MRLKYAVWVKCVSWSGVHVEKHSRPLTLWYFVTLCWCDKHQQNTSSNTRFEVLTAVWLWIQVFWQVTLCYVIHDSQCSEGPWWLYIQGFSSPQKILLLLWLLSVMQRHKSVLQIIMKISNTIIIECSSKILAIFSHDHSSCSG